MKDPKASSKQNGATAKAPLSRSWIPQRGISRYFNSKLLIVLSAFVLTCLVMFAVRQIDDSSPHAWLKEVLPFLTNTIFGLLLSSWLEKSKSDDGIRQEAIRIDEEVDTVLLQVSQSWQQIAYALRTLVETPTPEFLSAARYILGSQLNDAYNIIQRLALEVARIDLDVVSFLKETDEKFKRVRSMVSTLLEGVPQAPILAKLWDAYTKVDGDPGADLVRPLPLLDGEKSLAAALDPLETKDKGKEEVEGQGKTNLKPAI